MLLQDHGNASDPMVERLRAVARTSPQLREAAQLYEAILPVVRDADLGVAPPCLTFDEARRKLEQGVPLLADLEVEIDVEAADVLLLRLARGVDALERPVGVGAGAGSLLLALEEGRLDKVALLHHVLAGERDRVTAMATGLGLDPGLLWMLAQNVCRTALQALCRHLAHFLAGAAWDRGTCPVCGAGATLGELRENRQAKHLRCGQCGCDWSFGRLRCYNCGNDDHRTQRYLYRDGEHGRMHVEVCDVCRGYLKVVTTFAPTPPEMLTVEDLATLHLDSMARERGYLP